MGDYSDFIDGMGYDPFLEGEVNTNRYVGELEQLIYGLNVAYSENEGAVRPARSKHRARLEKYIARAKGPSRTNEDDDWLF